MTAAPAGSPSARWRRGRGRRATAARWGSTAALVLALLLLALTVLAGPGSVRLVTVQSGSMAPAMPEGALLVERPVRLGDLAVGDVITYVDPTPGARTVTHRVVEIDRSSGTTVVRTRGDANPGIDPWRAELQGDVTWRVAGVVPHVGRALDALRTPVGVLLVTVLLPVCVTVSALRRIWRPASSRPGAAPVGPGRRWSLGLLAAALVGSTAAVAAASTASAAAFSTSEARGHAVRTLLLETPTGVAVEDACVVTGAVVDVSWTPVGTGQSGFRIERRTDALGTWSVLGTAAASDTNFRDSTAQLATTYSYRVSAVRGPWTSAPPTPVSLTTVALCS